MKQSNAAIELLAGNLELHPDKPAYFCGNHVLSYRQLGDSSLRFANYLQNKGIVQGERVLISLPDSFAFPIVFLGCLLVGVMAVAVDPDGRSEDFSYIFDDCEPRLTLVHGDRRIPPLSSDARRTLVLCDDYGPLDFSSASRNKFDAYQPMADDIAYMLYSSGTTGSPKGVPHRHKSLILPCELVGKLLLDITSEDVIFSTSKLSFAYGLINSLAFPLFFGAASVLHPAKPDPLSVLDIIARRQPSVFFSTPTTYSQIILSGSEGQFDLPMRLCCSAGEALPTEVFHEWKRLAGIEILDGIGCSEMAYHFISNVPGHAVAGSAGCLVPGYEARLVNDRDKVVPQGSEGHLLIKGDTMSPFYWKLPDQSSESMLPDGFFRTGDIFVERNGFYYHRGRSDDMIKTDARWVSPRLVEDALGSHPAVADCAVASVKVGVLNKPGAFLVLKPGIRKSSGLAKELKSFLSARLPAYMCPVLYRFMDDLPRTSTGKVRRSALRE